VLITMGAPGQANPIYNKIPSRGDLIHCRGRADCSIPKCFVTVDTANRHLRESKRRAVEILGLGEVAPENWTRQ
jgi:hypothetical protein